MIERATDFGRVKRMTSSLPDLQQAGRFCTKLQAVLYNPGDRRPDILTAAMNPILLENAELNASEPTPPTPGLRSPNGKGSPIA
jgi:hypothetical protein